MPSVSKRDLLLAPISMYRTFLVARRSSLGCAPSSRLGLLPCIALMRLGERGLKAVFEEKGNCGTPGQRPERVAFLYLLAPAPTNLCIDLLQTHQPKGRSLL